MVALPVTGLVGIAIVADSHFSPSTQDTIRTQLGQNEASLQVYTPPNSGLQQNPVQPNWFTTAENGDGTLVSPRDALPAGTRILPIMTSSVTAATTHGFATFPVREGQTWDPSFSGMYDVVEGRNPRANDEVLVTESLLARLGKQLGDSVGLRNSAATSVTIVGIMDDRTQADSVEEFYAPSGALSGTNPFDDVSAGSPYQGLQNTSFYLPDLRVNWAMIQGLNAEGITVLSKSVLLDPPPADGSYPEYEALSTVTSVLPFVLIVAGFAAFEVILLAGAAFTVTARQQQRTLATIASVGAPQRLLFRILTANGLVLGAIGGVVGTLFGIGGAAAFMAITADGSATQYYGFHLPWLGMLLAVAFAVAIGWIASLLPARATSRFDIVAALRGSRKPPVHSTRRPIVGLILLLIGVALTVVGGVLLPIATEASNRSEYGYPLIWIPIVMLIVGPILLQIALILSGPLLLLVVARLMRRFSLGPRLASRDSARNPGRSVPALAAIMTTVFVAVFGMCVAAGSNDSMRQNYQYSAPVGTITVDLAQFDYTTAPETPSLIFYQHPDAIQQAIRSSVNADQVRTLSAVPATLPTDPNAPPTANRSLPNGESSDNLSAPTIPLATLPAKSLCPLNPLAPGYSADNIDNGLWQSDERCRNYYLQENSGATSHIFVGNSSDLAMVLGHEPSAAARQALSSGEAVSLYPEYVENGRFTISWWTPDQVWQLASGTQPGSPVRTEALAAVVDRPAHPLRFGVFISPATAKDLGLDYRDTMVIASTTTLPNTDQQDSLRQALTVLPDLDGNAQGGLYSNVELGPQDFDGPLVWGLLGLAGLIAIASSAVAIGLARFDGRQDDATLGALGAGRVVRKSFTFWQAIIIAGLGSVLGAATGLVPAWALASAALPFVPPWLHIGLVVLVLPLLIACGSWLLATRSKVSARRVAIA